MHYRKKITIAVNVEPLQMFKGGVDLKNIIKDELEFHFAEDDIFMSTLNELCSVLNQDELLLLCKLNVEELMLCITEGDINEIEFSDLDIDDGDLLYFIPIIFNIEKGLELARNKK